MSLYDMVMISLAGKFSSLASRRAATFCRAGSKFVVLHQAKVPRLQAAVVLERKPLKVIDAYLCQRCEQVQFALLIIWGGLVASIIFLVRNPEVSHFPPGGEAGDDPGDD